MTMSNDPDDPRDLSDPFQGATPTDVVAAVPTPSDSPRVTEAGPTSGEQARVTAFIGRPALYRMAFAAMPVPGFPSEVRIGSARVIQTPGPVRTQRTYVLQRPGWRRNYDKTMHQAWLEVGEGLHLTLCILDVTVPNSPLATAFAVWRDQALAAVGLVATVLDERIAQEVLLEDLVVFDQTGTHAEAAVDLEARIRAFSPLTQVFSAHRTTLAGLATVDLSADDPTLVAARWYLRGAQAGPTADGVIALCTAIDSLASSKTSFSVPAIEQAIAEADGDVDSLRVNVRQLARLRGEILHDGREQPDLLNDGYYVLEWIARLLLRHRRGLHDDQAMWALEPGQSNIRPVLSKLARVVAPNPKTTMRRVEGGPPIGPSADSPHPSQGDNELGG